MCSSWQRSPRPSPKRALHLCLFDVAVSSLQALPEDKKPLSAELFWLTFRLHAGLSLSPRDGNADIAGPSNKVDALASLFLQDDGTRNGTRDMALLVLCSFAEGSFKRSKTKKSKVRLNCLCSAVVGRRLSYNRGCLDLRNGTVGDEV